MVDDLFFRCVHSIRRGPNFAQHAGLNRSWAAVNCTMGLDCENKVTSVDFWLVGMQVHFCLACNIYPTCIKPLCPPGKTQSLKRLLISIRQ